MNNREAFLLTKHSPAPLDLPSSNLIQGRSESKDKKSVLRVIVPVDAVTPGDGASKRITYFRAIRR